MTKEATEADREQVLRELDALIAESRNVSKEDFCDAFHKAALVFPGGERQFMIYCAQMFKTASGTVSCWRNGHSAPAAPSRTMILKRLSEQLNTAITGL